MANFTKGSIEFLTVSIEFCKFAEQHLRAEERHDTLKKLTQLLTLLYLKATMVEVGEQIYDEEPEKFVDENDYNIIEAAFAELLGNDNQYLTAIHPDMALSDTAVVATISEDIADIYQPVKDFVSAAQLGNEDIMNDALIVCVNDFNEYWGTRLLSATLALHQIVIRGNGEKNEEN